MVISLQSEETEKDNLVLEEILKLNNKFRQLKSELCSYKACEVFAI